MLTRCLLSAGTEVCCSGLEAAVLWSDVKGNVFGFRCMSAVGIASNFIARLAILIVPSCSVVDGLRFGLRYSIMKTGYVIS